MSKGKSLVGITIFSLIFGIGMIALGVYLVFDAQGANIENHTETKGKVIRMYEATSTRLTKKAFLPDEYKTNLPLVEFTTQDGKKVEFLNKWAAEDEQLDYLVGEEVKVLYNSAKPEEAMIISGENFKDVSWFLFGIGLFILFIPKLIKISNV